MSLLDPLNPLAGLQNVPGVNQIPGADSYVTSGQITGFAENVIPSIVRGDNLLLSLGLGGLGAVKGGQTAASNLLNIGKSRQDLVKGGLDITKTGLEIQDKDYDLGVKKQSRSALLKYIYDLPENEQLLALSDPKSFISSITSGLQPTTSMKEYRLAKAEGYPGSYTDYVQGVEKYRAANYTSMLKMPEKERMLLESDMKYVERAVEEAMSARTIANETRLISDLLEGTSGGGVVKLTADLQQALGIDTPTANRTQVVEAIRTRAAPTIRATGSGSTSDMEFKAYMSAFPSLATLPEGRKLMSEIAQNVADRKMKLADYARKLASSKDPDAFSYEAIAKYDDELGSYMSSKIKTKINELREKEGLPPIVVDLKKSKSIVYGSGQ